MIQKHMKNNSNFESLTTTQTLISEKYKKTQKWKHTHTHTFNGTLSGTIIPSVLRRCWLGGRKGIWPVKNWVVGAGVAICLEQGADLYMAQRIPLPLTVSCFSKIQFGFTFVVTAHMGSPIQRAVKRVCVCVVRDYQGEPVLQR